MDFTIDGLAGELADLQEGMGLQDPAKRVASGVQISRILGVDPGADAHEVFTAYAARFLSLAEELPPNMRLVFLSACALRPDDLPRLTSRLERAAEKIGCSARNSWRLRKKANERIAAGLIKLAKNQGQVRDWVLTGLHAHVDLTKPQPVFRGRHLIRVTASSLQGFTERMTIPAAGPGADPTFRVSGDAELVRVTRLSQITWEAEMRFHRTLTTGERAEYVVEVQVPSPRLIHPLSAILPEREVTEFTTEIHFGSPSVAAQIWRHDGYSGPITDAGDSDGKPIDPATNPVVKAGFRNMLPGRVYGIRWTWA